jgi:hypothetical protein
MEMPGVSLLTGAVPVFGFFRRSETLKNLKQASLPGRKQNHLLTHLHQKNKKHPGRVLMFFGGDAGNRTRVHKSILTASTKFS